jgi:hypothetical protein
MIANFKIFEENQKIIGYHITLTKNDNDIEKNGIKPKNGKIYVWLDEKYADWFRDTEFSDEFGQYKQSTKYTIDLTGLDLIRDKDAENMNMWSSIFDENEFGEAYIIENDIIKPNRIIDKDTY